MMEPFTSAPTPEPAILVHQLLPKCSVVFFHHLEKTGGTTLRSVLQRHAQFGEFDFISFVNRFDKLQLQMVLHRLHSLLEQPGGLDNLRLAVEIHIGGHLNHPYFNLYTLPDLLLLRSLLRARGCRCHLVTLLRHPLLHHLSWHYHFCNHRVPLCFWRNPPDCQTRLALGLTCHDGPHLAPLTPEHERAVGYMWHAFDLVGVTELFDEFVLRLTDLVGLQRPAYRSQIVASYTLSRQRAQRNWTSLTCAQLLSSQPPDLMGLIAKRMEGASSPHISLPPWPSHTFSSRDRQANGRLCEERRDAQAQQWRLVDWWAARPHGVPRLRAVPRRWRRRAAAGG